jgi:hypothetical protein
MGLHHIHADPASGDVGDGLRRREPRLEDQVQCLPVAQFLSLLGSQKPLFDGFLFDPYDVDARPVIPDFDVDLPAFVIGAKRQSSLRRLASAKPDFRRLDTVVARVPKCERAGPGTATFCYVIPVFSMVSRISEQYGQPGGSG